MSLRFNDNLKRSFFLDTADLENERNQLLKPKNHKSYKQLKINRQQKQKSIGKSVVYDTENWNYCPEKTSVFFLKTDSVTVL